MAGKRPLQTVDANSNPLTSFAEGAILRTLVADDGAWHKVDVASQAVRLHVLPARKGVLYTTSKAAAVVEGDDVADHVANSVPLSSGAYLLTFAGDTELFLAADPDGTGAAPLVIVCQSAGA